MGVEFGHAVGAARVEGRGLVLGRFGDLAEQLRTGGLVESDPAAEGILLVADGLQQPQHPDTRHVGRVGGLVDEGQFGEIRAVLPVDADDQGDVA